MRLKRTPCLCLAGIVALARTADLVEISNQNHADEESVRFYLRVKWKKLLLLLWAITPVYGAAQIAPADLQGFTRYREIPLARFEEEAAAPSPASPTDSKGTSDESQVISSDVAARQREAPENRFQWKPAFAQYNLEISIQHAWRFAHEPGTRDATAFGPWFHDWIDSIGETRGWDDGDGWHASYVGHPLNGGIYGFIEQQNDPLYRKVEWGDGRIYWVSRLRALAFATVASTQWTLGPLSEASLGNVQLHASPGFIDLVQTPTLGVMEMMGEDMLDRYVVIPLENHTANPWLILATRSLCNPARSFASLMSLRLGWHRENRPGVFGENHTMRKELVREYKRGLTSAPFGPHTPEEKAAMNLAVETAHPKEAPIELHAYALYESLLNGHNCLGGGGQGVARIRPAWQVVSEVNGCMIVNTPTYESADSVTFSVGPRWTPRATHRFAPFVQMLFGGRRLTYEVLNPKLRDTLLKAWDDGNGTLPHCPKRSDYTVQYQALGFNLTMGGGFDAAFGRAFAWRVLELNYSHSWLPDVHSINASNTLQVRTGVVLRIGNW
jgi:hypothetical protein